MTILDNMINILGGKVDGNSYDLFQGIKDAHRNAPLHYESKWYNKIDQDYKSPPLLSKVSTFRGCIRWSILPKRKVKITVYNGDAFYGIRMDARCYFTVMEVPRKLLMPYVDEALNREAIVREEREEKCRREDRCREIYEDMLAQARQK